MTKHTVEEARESIQTFPNMVPSLKFYFEAVIGGYLPEYFFSFLNHRRGFSDELIDGELKEKFHPDYPFIKGSESSIYGTFSLLQDLIIEEFITDIDKINQICDFRFYKWNVAKGETGENLTTSEEIDYINQTLDSIISHFQQNYELRQEYIDIVDNYIQEDTNIKKQRAIELK